MVGAVVNLLDGNMRKMLYAVLAGVVLVVLLACDDDTVEVVPVDMPVVVTETVVEQCMSR